MASNNAERKPTEGGHHGRQLSGVNRARLESKPEREPRHNRVRDPRGGRPIRPAGSEAPALGSKRGATPSGERPIPEQRVVQAILGGGGRGIQQRTPGVSSEAPRVLPSLLASILTGGIPWRHHGEDGDLGSPIQPGHRRCSSSSRGTLLRGCGGPGPGWEGRRPDCRIRPLPSRDARALNPGQGAPQGVRDAADPAVRRGELEAARVEGPDQEVFLHRPGLGEGVEHPPDGPIAGDANVEAIPGEEPHS
eukprot:16427658-Heterocapsa_arctica.AAC.1